jgi:hypothetical protein
MVIRTVELTAFYTGKSAVRHGGGRVTDAKGGVTSQLTRVGSQGEGG